MKAEGFPSIFNDVIGPVMRGPSSSHTAASWRIARVCMQFLNDELAEALVEFDENGAWAPNYREQGTALGMDGGLLGIDITDERIIRADQSAKERDIRISYRVSSFETDHANTVRLTLKGRSGKSVRAVAVSTGGGMFEIRQYNGHRTRIQGDRFHLFAMMDRGSKEDVAMIQELLPDHTLIDHSENERDGLIQVRSSEPFPEHILKRIRELTGVRETIAITPVLPIVSGRELDFPFTDVDGMIAYGREHDYSLGNLGLIYERCRSGLSEDELILQMKEIIRIIEDGIAEGLAGTEYRDRILQQQSNLVGKAERRGNTKTNPLINQVIANITALMEAKSAMHVIVAVPTAGSCGTFGGTVKAFCDINAIGEEEKILAYFAGGLVGVFFARGPGFSAEEHGCQVETGASATMAAAALVDLSGGSAEQAVTAAAMALQNTIGLVCDPVADRVEVPCLGKNITAGLNAIGTSTMALSGFDGVIPFDQVLETVSRVGRSMSSTLRCTGKGGLAATAKSRELKEMLKKNS